MKIFFKILMYLLQPGYYNNQRRAEEQVNRRMEEARQKDAEAFEKHASSGPLKL